MAAHFSLAPPCCAGDPMPHAWLSMIFEAGFDVVLEKTWQVGAAAKSGGGCGGGGARGRAVHAQAAAAPQPATVISWPLSSPVQAYPRFDPPEDFARWELAEGLYYPNAIENAASAMEMSALAGRNAALLAARHLRSRRGGPYASGAAAAAA